MANTGTYITEVHLQQYDNGKELIFELTNNGLVEAINGAIVKLKLRKDVKPTRYKSKGQMKKMKQLTFHHIKMRKDGGRATVENGALLSAENHAWFHQQSSKDQTQMNAMFQEYKKQYQECEVVFVDDLDLGFEIKAMEFHIDEREQKKDKYNRAKEKREFQKRVEEELYR